MKHLSIDKFYQKQKSLSMQVAINLMTDNIRLNVTILRCYFSIDEIS